MWFFPCIWLFGRVVVCLFVLWLLVTMFKLFICVSISLLLTFFHGQANLFFYFHLLSTFIHNNRSFFNLPSFFPRLSTVSFFHKRILLWPILSTHYDRKLRSLVVYWLVNYLYNDSTVLLLMVNGRIVFIRLATDLLPLSNSSFLFHFPFCTYPLHLLLSYFIFLYLS